MKDIYKIKGHIIVECIDKKGTIIDRFENKNLIMDAARTAVSSSIAGMTVAAPMNKFVIGTEGHVTGDYLIPKTELQGFVSSRTELFSEELSSYTYPIVFNNPGTAVGPCVIVSEPDSGSTISLNYAGSDVEYTIEIPDIAGNSTGIAVFTEAALYAGDNIFSMKCFPGKIKDNTVSLRVVWTIKF